MADQPNGDFCTTFFQQSGNLPTTEVGVHLFFRLTQLTITSSMQLSGHSMNSLINFAPGDYNFNIPVIKKHLDHLFILSTTCDFPITRKQRLLHTIIA
jgi:hypothetical protein